MEKIIKTKIEIFLKKSLNNKKFFKTKETITFIECFYDDFFSFKDIEFNQENLLQKRNNATHIIELIIVNNQYIHFDIEILNTIINFIDEYTAFMCNQEKETI